MRAIGFPLSLLLNGVIGTLLAVTLGASLGIGEPRGGQRSPLSEDRRGCVSFLVGAQGSGEIHLHLANAGGEALSSRLELVDEVGDRHPVETVSLGPHATHLATLRRPAVGTGLKVSSPNPDLRVRAEIVFDDGSEPEPYRPGGCA